MKCWLRIVAIFFAVVTSVSSSLFSQTTARDELKLGVQAYRQSKFDEAIQHFETCVTMDPANSVAHLYLATSYAQQYIPGVETPENVRFAQQAVDQYQQVLDSDPPASARTNSTKGIAYLDLQMKKFDDSKKYYRMASDLNPNDPENYYFIAVIDWTQTYVPRQEARAKLRLELDEALANDQSACLEIKYKNAANVQEGIDNLNKALQLRPDYDDAMAYLNLMYRERADIQCDDPTARGADLRTADEWVDKTIAIKKANAKKAEKGSKPAASDPQ